MEWVLEKAGLPQPYRHGEAEITVVELPAGPACRLHEMMLDEEGDDGRQLMIEHIDYFILPSASPDVLVKLSVNWASTALGTDMVDVADAMAAAFHTTPEEDALATAGTAHDDRRSEGGRMTELVPSFDFPGGGEWLWLDVHNPHDGAERVARQVAERGGRRNKQYAKETYRQLMGEWAQAAEERVEPVVVYVPRVRRNAAPTVPAHILAVPYVPEHDRTIEATLARLNVKVEAPTVSYLQESSVTVVELPIGPACRQHDAFLADTGRGDQVAIESVNYHVLPKELADEMLMLELFWVKDSAHRMVELADAVAASLRLIPRSSDDVPRPVLAGPDTGQVFDEVQIGRGLRPMAQHGFVTIDQGVLSLLSSDRQLIASAPLPQITAWPIRASVGTAVGMEINGTKYNAAPGRGSYPKAFTLPTDLMKGRSAADQLLELITDQGGNRRGRD